MNWRRVSSVAAGAFALGIGISGNVSASGFAIIENSGSGMGNAFAGAAAVAEDASTVYFNPAGMMRLQGSQVDTALHYIVPSSEFTNGGSTINALLGGAPLPGADGRDPGVNAAVPNLYYVREIGTSLKLGLGVTAPFGLKTSYTQNWVGRYHAITSSIKSININPSLAMRINDKVSIGVGFSAMYLEARLTNAVDKSAVCLGVAPAATCAAFGLVTPGTEATDGFIDLQLDDWGYGYNVGVLFEPSEQTRVGISYRSRVIQNTTGTADFTNTADLAALFAGTAPGAFADQTASAQVSLPETISVSAYHQMTPKWGLMGDVTWTN